MNWSEGMILTDAHIAEAAQLVEELRKQREYAELCKAALKKAVGLLSRDALIEAGYDQRQEWQRLTGDESKKDSAPNPNPSGHPSACADLRPPRASADPVGLGPREPRSFSDFIRNASPEEKAEVYGRVMDEASEAQRSQMGDRIIGLDMDVDVIDDITIRWADRVWTVHQGDPLQLPQKGNAR